MRLQRRLYGIYTVCVIIFHDSLQLQTCFFLSNHLIAFTQVRIFIILEFPVNFTVSFFVAVERHRFFKERTNEHEKGCRLEKNERCTNEMDHSDK